MLALAIGLMTVTVIASDVGVEQMPRPYAGSTLEFMSPAKLMRNSFGLSNEFDHKNKLSETMQRIYYERQALIEMGLAEPWPGYFCLQPRGPGFVKTGDWPVPVRDPNVPCENNPVAAGSLVVQGAAAIGGAILANEVYGPGYEKTKEVLKDTGEYWGDKIYDWTNSPEPESE